jgi:hypothetical protein
MKRKGLALIAVIVMIVLFTSLILAVVLSATMSIRRANYYKDKLIALEIAETGLQKILYNMNYYGYQENNTGTGWSKASWIGSNFKSSSFSLPKWYSDLITSKGLTENDLTKYETEISLPEYGGKGKYTLYFIDANSQTTSETDLDLIVAKGSYRGRTATISFLLRGAGEIKIYGVDYYYGDFKDKNPNRTLGTCGIPEAFNKHVIYAETLGLSSSIPNTVEINGNISSDNRLTSIDAMGKKTYTDSSFFTPVLSDENKPSYPSVSIPSDPGSYDDEYDNSGNRIQGTPTGNVNSINDGVYWDAATSTYHFGTDDGTNPASYTRNNNSVRINSANARLRFGVNINGYFKCERGSITIESFNTNTCFEANSITINNGTINGPIFLKSSTINLNGNSTINGNLILTSTSPTFNFGGTGTISFNNGNFIVKDASCTFISGSIITINNGSVISNSNLTINNQLTINSNANNKYAISLVSLGDISLTFDSNSQIKLNLVENQISGIIVYSNGGSTTANLYSSLSDITKLDTQATIISYSETSSSTITIKNQSSSNDLTIKGLIYSYSLNNSNITVESITSKKTIINGILVAKNVELKQNSVINYDSKSFKNSSGEVFVGFVGGRRKYLPVPGSWRIEW